MFFFFASKEGNESSKSRFREKQLSQNYLYRLLFVFDINSLNAFFSEIGHRFYEENMLIRDLFY
ncbi:hypothetical protein P5673_028645 [Acropora cervicornis]|uniref:Uncharacterized protein n=1 Tax=Acropora cervicornis TaxID=6130 RepID=A0AAD9UUZ3_ACRCE|nr:hypothetical protein P5673_028645 [Acropora cervicornis]